MPIYRTADPAPTSSDFTTLVNQLLYNRGLTTLEDQKTFLFPEYETARHDPFLLHNMDKAVNRIEAAMNADEKMTVFSDYDCDGIPGGVILHDFFKAIGYTNFTNYIPHRHFEGFGLNTEAIDKLNEQGVKLIITVDCGTSDVAAVAHANQLGIDVIITDHHEAPETMPEAVAIVNPKIGDTYPFDGLCGAGVAFKLVEAMIKQGDYELTPGWEKWWLDMVGIATIGDMVPLIDENRVFARYGLEVLRKSRRPGLHHLLRKARANQRFLTEDDVGFTIGPRINAASRMDTPEDAFVLLSTTDEAEAGARVEHLEKLNNERKGMVAAITKELHKRLKDVETRPEVLVMGNPAWRPALVGLAAGKLAEEYNAPVFLWGRDGNGIIKGSCRSGGGVSIVKLMDGAADAFLEHGGHHYSGGFAVKEDAIFSLPDRLNQVYAELGEMALNDEERLVDAEIMLSDVHKDLLAEVQQLAPYGVGNPRPLFMLKDVRPSKVEQFGKTGDHLKLGFTRDYDVLEAIAFFASPTSYGHEPKVDEPLTLLAHVEESFFMGRRQIRLRVVDIVETL